MKPVRCGRANPNLFRERLDAIINMRHGLVRLAALMPWSAFDESFGKFFKPIGRPAEPTRLMVGLHYLKHVYNLPDEEVVKATVAVALETGTVKPSSLERVTEDTTVQTKAIAHPTDSRLYLKALLVLVGQAKKAGVELRQSHTRLAKRAAMKAGRYAHARQFKRMRRELKRLKTYLGRVFRDVCRKIDGHIDLAVRFSKLLGLIERLLAQKPDDNNKLYALHAPEVVCISKGKAHKRYEFGCNVGIAATNHEELFIAAMAFEGNPYDGHTLKASAAKTKEMTSVAIQRLYVDKGYRGHDYDGKAKVMISGNKRGLTPTMKRELQRRSAIEPMIGHAKNDGRLGRNYLLGADGDKINALLAAAGHNLQLVITRLAHFLARFIGAVARLMTKGSQISIAGDPGSAFPNIGTRLSALTTSMA